ncbi:MAG: hypothetical protein QOC69_1176, partial [Mycobacterium sp.]|nr:hypothetical protein [Mycobacterium sp.]
MCKIGYGYFPRKLLRETIFYGSGSSTSWPNPDPVDAGPVIQVNADVVAGTSEQMADTAVDVVR